jgi:branched-subunit amino acid aminotransferase/4-amino-4-deoxychorismate lyase
MAVKDEKPRSPEPYVRCFDVNGARLVPAVQPAPGPFDMGFLYGLGLFETILVHRGRPVLLNEHVERMLSSADFFKINHKPSLKQISGAVEEGIRSFGANEAILKLILTVKGNGRFDAADRGCLFLVQVLSPAPPPRAAYERGVKLLTASSRRSAQSPVYRHKTLNYLENIIARSEAQAEGAYDALIVNTDELIAECAMSNIFFVDAGRLITPSVECNILPGVTRARVLALAEEEAIETSERPIGFVDVLEATEVFITNSLAGIVPVREIDGKAFGSACPGPITRTLSTAYAERVLNEKSSWRAEGAT